MKDYYKKIKKLAELFITRNITEGNGTVVTFDDLLMRYYDFVGSNRILDEDLLVMVLTRFPRVEVNYGEGILKNVVWKDQIKVYIEPPPVVPYTTRLLDFRLETMLSLHPQYVKNGITIEQFAGFIKNSISGGVLKEEIDPIPVEESTTYLKNNSKLLEKNGKYYQKEEMI